MARRVHRGDMPKAASARVALSCYVRAVLAISLCAGLAGWTTEVSPGPASKTKQTRPAAKAHPVEAAASPSAPAADTADPPHRPTSGQRVPKVAATSVALAATLEGDDKGTALVLTLSRSARFTTFTLAEPYRVIVDLQDVDFRVPPSAGTVGRGLVQSFRYGLLAPGKSRIVIDVKGPVAIDKADIVALRGAETVQLRVALSPSSREQFLEGAMARPAAPAPAATAQAPAAKKPRSGKPVIVLDPGHGGLDAGTIGSPSVTEKDVVLRFARTLRDRLRASGRYEVHMTREMDVFIRLDDRVRIAREHGCDLFISLHTDSVPAQIAHLNVRGATVYTMSEATGDARAQQLAEKENHSDVIAGVEVLQDEQPEVASILTDLMRRETANHTQAFSTTLIGYMRKTTGMSREPHRHAAFRVLRAPDMASVLIELGFLSNKEDEKLLVSAPWQEQTAAAVSQAVDSYFGKRLAKSPF